MTYRVLCLTDHDTHSPENSLYAIVSAMCNHEKCTEVVVASRSAEVNASFFEKQDFSYIHGVTISNDFNYDSAQSSLHAATRKYTTEDFDILFLRLPRPVSDSFLLNLESYFSSACIINRPSGIIECSSKSVLVNFLDVCPPIKLCYTIEEILEFSSKHDIVLKPLKEYGGKGLLRINGNVLNDGKADYNLTEYLSDNLDYIEEEGYLAMKYLKNVSQGDKRLIVVDGEILAASLRLPAAGSWLCNVSMGGTSVRSEPDESERAIVEAINPYLKERGILIYGVDTLVDDDQKRILSEINALSIGGFPQAEKQTGKPIIKTTLDKIFNYADVQLYK